MYYNTPTFKREIPTLSLEKLYQAQREIIEILADSDDHGVEYQRLWLLLAEDIPLWIGKKVAGQAYIEIRSRNRGKEPEECGYDEVLHEQLLA